MDSLKVLVCQLNSSDDFEKNLRDIENLIEPFQNHNLDLLSLPENCLFMRTMDSQGFPNWNQQSDIFDFFKRWAVQNHCAVHLGSVPLMIKDQRFNATVWVDENGSLSTPYQKIHLFDVDVKNHQPVRESDNFEPGSGPAWVKLKDWKIGLSICYDLRFSELYSIYSKEACDLVLVPSAFLVPTGKAHWHILVRARAIETQAFVLAAAQAGQHGDKRKTFGHSLIVGPWGEIISEGDGEHSVALAATLQKASLVNARDQIPMSRHRRL